MKYKYVTRGLLLILVGFLCPSCLDNDCEDAFGTTSTVRFSKSDPGDLASFQPVSFRKIACTRTLENVCEASLITVELQMITTKDPEGVFEVPTAMIDINGKLPAVIYHISRKTFKNKELHTYTCSSMAESGKSTVTISVYTLDQINGINLNLVESLWVDIHYYQLSGGSNP